MNTLWHATWYTFSYLVFFYSMAIMASYLVLVWLSYREQKSKEKEVPDDETLKYMLKSSPLTPAVSVIAPAYNEHVNIITNAYSLLGLDYPSFEVIIVNDGSSSIWRKSRSVSNTRCRAHASLPFTSPKTNASPTSPSWAR